MMSIKKMPQDRKNRELNRIKIVLAVFTRTVHDIIKSIVEWKQRCKGQV